MVEYFSEELLGAQLQEIQTTEDGVVFAFYRFIKEPRLAYLVFDLDLQFPFVGLFMKNPWPKLKKVKPVGLFLNSHAKNQMLGQIQLLENFGRVVEIALGPEDNRTTIHFRMIPKNTNLLMSYEKKSISWYPQKDLSEQISAPPNTVFEAEEIRSIHFIADAWLQRRGIHQKAPAGKAPDANGPFEKWKAQREKDLAKKKKAIEGILQQIDDYLYFPWNEIGEHLKIYGFKELKPEWNQHLNFSLSTSQNIQLCFTKAKAGKIKAVGARKRLAVLQQDTHNLLDNSQQVFENFLLAQQQRQQNKNAPRAVEGRYRKLVLEHDKAPLTCYMGKSAKDNSDLLRKAKAWDYWIHLKDYPSAYAIIHRQKAQSVSQSQITKVGEWLVRESIKEKKSTVGLKMAVVYVECRHVRPIKGDKLGRVTYHEAREILIAL